MSQEPMNLFVAMLALVVSGGAGAAALNVWHWPYQLRAARTMQARWGRAAARSYFAILAGLMLLAAIAILIGLRPRYATSGLTTCEGQPVAMR